MNPIQEAITDGDPEVINSVQPGATDLYMDAVEAMVEEGNLDLFDIDIISAARSTDYVSDLSLIPELADIANGLDKQLKKISNTIG